MLRRIILCIGLLGCLQLCCYRVTSAMSALDGHSPAPQPDTWLYCQAAKRVAQGHAFSYSSGEPCSTGTTSILYPFVLAVPYAMGAKGERLLEVGFWINGAFYLIFLLGWVMAYFRWIDGARSKWLAAILLAISGQPAICAFAQSDTGFWMAVSAVLAAAIAWDRWVLVTLVVALCPWVRPEGMYVVAAMMAIIVCCKSWRRRLLLPVVVGIVSSFAVFGLNHCLTGRFLFDSLAHKGYFSVQSFSSAYCGAVHDAFVLFRAYFVGLDENWPRMVFTVPIAGGLFLWIGIFTRRWNSRRDVPLACLGFAMLLSFAVLSTSQQMGQNFERYLAWTVPLFILFTASGVVRFEWVIRIRRIRLLPTFLVVLFYLGVSVSCVVFFHSSSKAEAAVDEYYRAAEVAMEDEDVRVNRDSPGRVGGLSCAGVYFYADRQFRNLVGIYSPEFFEYYLPPTAIELLKHRTDLRFEYWQNYALKEYCDMQKSDRVLGPVLLAGPGDFGIRRADWSAFNLAIRLPQAPTGTSLKTWVDVGYLEDEKQTEYEVLDRWGRQPRPITLAVAKLDGKIAVDAGRVVVGGDSMTVDLEPGRDCHVTVRALSKQDGILISDQIKLLVQVDDVDVEVVTYDLEDKPDEFQERTFIIPGRFICRQPCRVAFLGDHIVCGYWFWQ